MHSLSEILTNTSKVPTNGTNGLKLNKTNGFRSIDLVIVEAGSVINSDPNYYKWYCRMAHKLGPKRFLELAREAIVDGKNPKRLFTYLLKKNTQAEHTHGKSQENVT